MAETKINSCCLPHYEKSKKLQQELEKYKKVFQKIEDVLAQSLVENVQEIQQPTCSRASEKTPKRTISSMVGAESGGSESVSKRYKGSRDATGKVAEKSKKILENLQNAETPQKFPKDLQKNAGSSAASETPKKPGEAKIMKRRQTICFTPKSGSPKEAKKKLSNDSKPDQVKKQRSTMHGVIIHMKQETGEKKPIEAPRRSLRIILKKVQVDSGMIK